MTRSGTSASSPRATAATRSRCRNNDTIEFFIYDGTWITVTAEQATFEAATTQLEPGATTEAELTVGNPCNVKLSDVAVQLQAPAGWTVVPASTTLGALARVPRAPRGQMWWASPTLFGSDPPLPVSVDVTGAHVLRLRVHDSGNGNGFDHADWAAAVLNCQE